MAESTLLFCVCCFATNEDGSWGETTVGEENSSHCLNCGAGNSCFSLPEWAVKSIRQQASWVGKRYYPHEEDKETAAELERLRVLAPEVPRTYEELEDGNWKVTQKTEKGSMSMTFRGTLDEVKARAKLRFPYDPGPHAQA